MRARPDSKRSVFRREIADLGPSRGATISAFPLPNCLLLCCGYVTDHSNRNPTEYREYCDSVCTVGTQQRCNVSRGVCTVVYRALSNVDRCEQTHLLFCVLTLTVLRGAVCGLRRGPANPSTQASSPPSTAPRVTGVWSVAWTVDRTDRAPQPPWSRSRSRTSDRDPPTASRRHASCETRVARCTCSGLVRISAPCRARLGGGGSPPSSRSRVERRGAATRDARGAGLTRCGAADAPCCASISTRGATAAAATTAATRARRPARRARRRRCAAMGLVHSDRSEDHAARTRGRGQPPPLAIYVSGGCGEW